MLSLSSRHVGTTPEATPCFKIVDILAYILLDLDISHTLPGDVTAAYRFPITWVLRFVFGTYV